MVDKKTKKKEVNIDKIEQMINRFQKKKTLSKPSTDLMSKINQRIQNVKSRNKSKPQINKTIPHSSPPTPANVSLPNPSPVQSTDESVVANEIDELLKQEDERKKQQINELTAAEKLKKDYLDLFNNNKEKPPINNTPPTKISTKKRKQILEEVKDNKTTIDPTINLDNLKQNPNKRQYKKRQPKQIQTQKKTESLLKTIDYLQGVPDETVNKIIFKN